MKLNRWDDWLLATYIFLTVVVLGRLIAACALLVLGNYSASSADWYLLGMFAFLATMSWFLYRRREKRRIDKLLGVERARWQPNSPDN